LRRAQWTASAGDSGGEMHIDVFPSSLGVVVSIWTDREPPLASAQNYLNPTHVRAINVAPQQRGVSARRRAQEAIVIEYGREPRVCVPTANESGESKRRSEGEARPHRPAGDQTSGRHEAEESQHTRRSDKRSPSRRSWRWKGHEGRRGGPLHSSEPSAIDTINYRTLFTASKANLDFHAGPLTIRGPTRDGARGIGAGRRR